MESDCQLHHAYSSVRTEQHDSYWKDFNEILYLRIFKKSVEKNSSVTKRSTRKTDASHEDLCVQLWQYLAELFLQRDVFHTKVEEKTKTHLKMRFSFRIPEARKQTHSHNIYYLLLQN
jgi:hypothetical protein